MPGNIKKKKKKKDSILMLTRKGAVGSGSQVFCLTWLPRPFSGMGLKTVNERNALSGKKLDREIC